MKKIFGLLLVFLLTILIGVDQVLAGVELVPTAEYKAYIQQAWRVVTPLTIAGIYVVNYLVVKWLLTRDRLDLSLNKRMTLVFLVTAVSLLAYSIPFYLVVLPNDSGGLALPVYASLKHIGSTAVGSSFIFRIWPLLRLSIYVYLLDFVAWGVVLLGVFYLIPRFIGKIKGRKKLLWELVFCTAPFMGMLIALVIGFIYLNSVPLACDVNSTCFYR